MSFPNIPCPLHVFEPRYRLMIRLVLRNVEELKQSKRFMESIHGLNWPIFSIITHSGLSGERWRPAPESLGCARTATARTRRSRITAPCLRSGTSSTSLMDALLWTQWVDADLRLVFTSSCVLIRKEQVAKAKIWPCRWLAEEQKMVTALPRLNFSRIMCQRIQSWKPYRLFEKNKSKNKGNCYATCKGIQLSFRRTFMTKPKPLPYPGLTTTTNRWRRAFYLITVSFVDHIVITIGTFIVRILLNLWHL